MTKREADTDIERECVDKIKQQKLDVVASLEEVKLLQPVQSCSHCKQFKTLDCYDRLHDGHHSQCKACSKALRDVRKQREIIVVEKPCKTCGIRKLATEFNKSPSYADGLFPVCKECDHERSRARAREKDGFLAKLQGYCKTRCKGKKEDGKVGAYDLPNGFTTKQAAEQMDDCWYSGVPAVYEPNSSWQASLEAMDPALGHIVGNTVLVVLELNHRCGWSREKVVEHLKGRHTVIEQAFLQRLIQLILADEDKARHEQQKREGGSGIVEHYCWDCSTWKAVTVFPSPTHLTCCRACANTRATATPHRRAMRMLQSAKQRTQRRNGKQHRKIAQALQEFKLTLQDVVALVLRQRNRCYWSGQPLDWNVGANHWAPSFERLDVRKGYTQDNVVLVAAAFNAADYSSYAKLAGTGQGHHGWSKEKYAYFFQCATRLHHDKLSALDCQFEITS